MNDSNENVIDEFIEKMGLMSQSDGLPRIAGRILAVLIMYDEPYSFSQLSERLAVSRGSVSTNTRLLVHLGMIERVTKRGERQDYFKLKENPYLSLMQGIEARTTHATDVIEQTQNQLLANDPSISGAQQRLTEMKTFYQSFKSAIQDLTS
ncbi:MarR family transcriptional regulator [Glaciecola sp. XM2]|jgi:DNA-binding transcriptional regulator GbsR (MarR family)|uniref:GbsR/MarR family transcriptional regulator n=1 Tax=Glaciecola sp. XM2 TaxID=1914931 RepID=UPI001BDDFA02|nr:MarR family transcriptional regulator [Glaciecola sp. XM2]MBT1452443.1 MarR family transcriptional regulator [Glaciecola sp. XM2]